METRILFVCTGNVFRSMAAEHCLKKYLSQHHTPQILVASAGTDANPEERILPELLTYLSSLGVEASSHRQRRLEHTHVKESNLVVAMAEDHQRFIMERFSHPSYLFNDVCYGKKSSVLDICDMIPDWKSSLEESMRYARETLQYIHDAMPLFLENAPSLFSKLC